MAGTEPVDKLDDDELEGLLEALDDEHRAHATYQQVLADFGAGVLPFANIVAAEARHIDALVALLHRYDIDVPTNPWSGKTARFTSVAEACRAGVDAEISNADLYDRLLASTNRPDVLEVYRNLRRASQENHLPAFRRGASDDVENDQENTGRRRRRRGGRS